MTTITRRRVVRSAKEGKNMRRNQTDEAGVPIIEGMQAKIGVLERRAEYLERKLERESYQGTASSDFDRHELSALRAALRTMRFHASSLRPEVDPVVALARLISAASSLLSLDMEATRHAAISAALSEARAALAEHQ